MATALIDQYNASIDESLVQKVEMSIDAAAQAISAEASTTTNHTNRVALAKAVANAPATYAPLFAAIIAAQGIDTSSTDIDINNMVSAVWDCMAGVA